MVVNVPFTCTTCRYNLTDAGGKSGLPETPRIFPWPAPLSAKKASLGPEPAGAGAQYTAGPFSFAIVELQ